MQSDTLMLSRRLASVLGPIAIVVGLSEMANMEIWRENDPRLTYLNGMMLFAAGLAILRFHRRLRPFWAGAVTATAVLLAAGGVFRLFFPGAPQAADAAAYAAAGALCVLGLTMTAGAALSRAPPQG